MYIHDNVCTYMIMLPGIYTHVHGAPELCYANSIFGSIEIWYIVYLRNFSIPQGGPQHAQHLVNTMIPRLVEHRLQRQQNHSCIDCLACNDKASDGLAA